MDPAAHCPTRGLCPWKLNRTGLAWAIALPHSLLGRLVAVILSASAITQMS